MGIKLRQGQLWKTEDAYIRLVHLERLEVEYKLLDDLDSGKGMHRRASKKEFCRLIKKATLVEGTASEPGSPPGKGGDPSS